MAAKDKYAILDNPRRILVGGAVAGIGGFLLYKLGKGIIGGIQKRNTEMLADDSPEVQQAMALRSAMNPSGIEWMMAFDTTDAKAVLGTGQQVKDLDGVASAYRKLYSSDLLLDLQKELSTADYQKFLTLVSSNPAKSGGAAPISFAKKNQLIVAKAEVFLRTSPDASYHGAIYEIGDNKNIIRKAKAGEFLGYATGEQSFDAKNNVKFIKAGYLIKKEGPPAAQKANAGKSFVHWVSSGANHTEAFAYYKDMWAKYPGTQAETSYKKPLDYYSGVAGMVDMPVVTVKATRALDEQFKNAIVVGPGTLLGSYLGRLYTGKGSYIKFRTVDNTIRWAAASGVTIQSAMP